MIENCVSRVRDAAMTWDAEPLTRHATQIKTVRVHACTYTYLHAALLTYICVRLSKSDLIMRVRIWSFGKMECFILTET